MFLVFVVDFMFKIGSLQSIFSRKPSRTQIVTFSLGQGCDYFDKGDYLGVTLMSGDSAAESPNSHIFVRLKKRCLFGKV